MITVSRLASFLLLVISFSLSAQTGKIFPDVEAENLLHEEVLIPKDIKGKHTLIGLAFSKKSEDDLKGWYDPVYNQLIKKPEAGSLFDFSYDVNVYFIPMLSGAKKAAYGKVMKKFEKEVDPKLHPHVVFYKGSLKNYQDALNIVDKKDPYFFLLDEEGKIIYATKGGFGQNKLQTIIDKLPF